MLTTTRVDFAEIREKVDLRDWLRAEGIALPDRLRTSIRCPFPDHDDSTPSCVIRPTGFHCYGCGRKGSILDYVMLRYGYTSVAAAAAHIVEKRPHLQAAPKVEALPRAPHPKDTPADPKLERLLSFFGQHLMDPDCARYLAQRGLRNLRVLRESGVGFSTKYRRVVFPTYVWREGKRVALNFSGRAIDASETIRYRQYTGARPTTCFMAGLAPLGCPERVAVVEGQIDALSIADVGVPAMATAGAGRLEPLAHTMGLYPGFKPQRIIHVQDNDKTSSSDQVTPAERFAVGLEALFAQKLPGVPVVRVRVPQGLKDANDWLRADRSEFAKALVRA